MVPSTTRKPSPLDFFFGSGVPVSVPASSVSWSSVAAGAGSGFFAGFEAPRFAGGSGSTLAGRTSGSPATQSVVYQRRFCTVLPLRWSTPHSAHLVYRSPRVFWYTAHRCPQSWQSLRPTIVAFALRGITITAQFGRLFLAHISQCQAQIPLEIDQVQILRAGGGHHGVHPASHPAPGA